jgi:hypothetical protein
LHYKPVISIKIIIGRDFYTLPPAIIVTISMDEKMLSKLIVPPKGFSVS